MASQTTPSPPPPQIWHTTIGPPTNPSLILLHGLFCSHIEFLPLIPFLSSDFHIILIDLPGHSRSRSLTLNLPDISSSVASLIRTVSPTGTAHVAGMSYGAFVGLDLARRYPDVVDSLFASGAPPFEGKERFAASRPWLMSAIVGLTVYMPNALYFYLAAKVGMREHVELRAESRANFDMRLVRQGYADCLSVSLEHVGQIRGVRTAVVAGGKQDDVDVTRRMGKVLREGQGGEECRAYVVRGAMHGWDLQFPELFAEGIKKWAEGGEMDGRFEELV